MIILIIAEQKATPTTKLFKIHYKIKWTKREQISVRTRNIFRKRKMVSRIRCATFPSGRRVIGSLETLSKQDKPVAELMMLIVSKVAET